MKLIPGDPAYWQGILAWLEDDGLYQPWRLPPERIALARAPVLASRAQMAAGARAVFRTDATALRLLVRTDDDAVTPLDVLVDNALWRREPLRVGTTTFESELPAGSKLVEVWLPQFGEIRIGPLEIEGASTIESIPNHALRWVTYGSSITQCRTAYGPSETWPALVARTHGWNLTCYGFGGQCHLDPIALEVMTETPAEFISCCLGINIYGQATFSERTLPGQISHFMESIRHAHATIPIAVITPIFSPEREHTPNAVGMTLIDVRQAIADAVSTLNERSDGALFLIDGLSIIGNEDGHLLEDGLHPSADGYRAMAERLAPRLHDAASTAIPSN